MQPIYTTKKFHLPYFFMGFVALLLTSCGTYNTGYSDSDGIYDSNQDAVAVEEETSSEKVDSARYLEIIQILIKAGSDTNLPPSPYFWDLSHRGGASGLPPGPLGLTSGPLAHWASQLAPGHLGVGEREGWAGVALGGLVHLGRLAHLGFTVYK